MNVLRSSERPLGVCIFLGGGSIRFHIPKEVCDPKDVKSQGKPLTPPSDDDRRAFPALSGSFSRKPFLNYSYRFSVRYASAVPQEGCGVEAGQSSSPNSKNDKRLFLEFFSHTLEWGGEGVS